MNSKYNILSILFLVTAIVIVPLFQLYNFPGLKVNFMNIGLGIILMICGLSRFFFPRIELDIAYVPLLIYIPLQTIYACFMFSLDESALVLSVGQYLGYIVLLSFFNRELFNFDIAKHIIFIISDIACIYIILQQVLASIFGIYIGAGIPFLEVSNDTIANYTDTIAIYGLGYRPRSFFSEPAMFATYVLLPVVILLYDIVIVKTRKFRDYLRLILYLTGILICRSSLGIVSAISIGLIYYGIFCVKKHFKITVNQLVIVFFIIALLGIISQTSFAQFQIERLIYGDLGTEDRLKFLANIDQLDLTSTSALLFGHDFKLLTYTGDFLPSFFRHLYCFGIIGELFLFIMLGEIFIRGNCLQRIILISFVIQMLGSELLHGGNFLLYFIWLAKCNGNRLKNNT